MSDEEIQKSVELGENQSNDPESRAYRAVFRSMSRAPRVELSSTFAERVMRRITVQKKREARRDFVWLSFGVVFLLIGLVVTTVIAGLQFQLGFLTEMSGYAGVFIFGIVVIIAFNWLEKKTLIKPMH